MDTGMVWGGCNIDNIYPQVGYTRARLPGYLKVHALPGYPGTSKQIPYQTHLRNLDGAEYSIERRGA